MALTRKGEYFHGDSRVDLRPFLERFSAEGPYAVDRMEALLCECGAEVLELLIDDVEGVGAQRCPRCSLVVALGDCEEFLDQAAPLRCECPCGGAVFELLTGVSFYAGTTDSRWFYVAGRCPNCGLVGCYGDWKTP
ncbi:hypothetical protein LY474_19655 [Myxococcus stipitatus]|uniref:hypothetical protein n=1 Tax=Myxococcus stipitatus TaxID=83455 RepID=UPI001F39C138|nr:hypothetical protein [Myxococcus stipitatus]MCE9670018.1 hypothetical protein [Myxococcus stipitatus]